MLRHVDQSRERRRGRLLHKDPEPLGPWDAPRLRDLASSLGGDPIGASSPPASASYHERLVPARLAIERSARRASFTDLESGKAWVNSGSRSTTLVPARYRSTYLPRTPAEKSYSGLISTAARLERGFFVFPTFMLCCSAGTDQSRPLSSHSMDHYQEPMITKRSSSAPSSGSGIVIESGSPKTVLASANPTGCLRRFDSSFLGSHSNGSPCISP